MFVLVLGDTSLCAPGTLASLAPGHPQWPLSSFKANAGATRHRNAQTIVHEFGHLCLFLWPLASAQNQAQKYESSEHKSGLIWQLGKYSLVPSYESHCTRSMLSHTHHHSRGFGNEWLQQTWSTENCAANGGACHRCRAHNSCWNIETEVVGNAGLLKNIQNHIMQKNQCTLTINTTCIRLSPRDIEKKYILISIHGFQSTSSSLVGKTNQ